MSPASFISYSWDSDEHKIWVRSLATRLQSGGVSMRLDQWDVRPGADIARYMETGVRESDFVLLICTNTFAKKANAGHGGVGYEKTIVTGEVFNRVAPETKFIPILREGDQVSSLPSYLLSKVFIDFRKDSDFEIGIEQLLRHLHNAPEFVPPPLGQVPAFSSTSKPHSPITAPSVQTFDVSAFEKLYRFAYGSGTLDLSRDQAITWAEEKSKENPKFDIDRFEKLYRFAFGSGALDLSREQAIAWAEEKSKTVPSFDIDTYEQLHRFAYNAGALDLSRDEAIAWAEEKFNAVPVFDIATFERLYRFAYGSDTLDLSKEDALAWAENQMRLPSV